MPQKVTRDLAEVIRRKLAKDAQLAAAVDDVRFDINVSEKIHEARLARGLTQKQLADVAGMKQSVIARLEDADYAGHTLSTLQRLSAALGMKLEVRFVAADTAPRSKRTARKPSAKSAGRRVRS